MLSEDYHEVAIVTYIACPKELKDLTFGDNEVSKSLTEILEMGENGAKWYKLESLQVSTEDQNKSCIWSVQ